MTESSCAGSTTKDTDKFKSDKAAYETIGRPFPFVEAKIVDPKTGKLLILIYLYNCNFIS
jgi:acyl-CoA synthetase (AMP-forming)/AMP-acid ligase II